MKFKCLSVRRRPSNTIGYQLGPMSCQSQLAVRKSALPGIQHACDQVGRALYCAWRAKLFANFCEAPAHLRARFRRIEQAKRLAREARGSEILLYQFGHNLLAC